MNITESHIAQAIQYAKEGNPNDMQDSIGVALMNKIGDAVDLKKISMAGDLFDSYDIEEEYEDVDEGAIGDAVARVGSSVRGALDRRAEAQKKKKDLEHVRNIARKYR